MMRARYGPVLPAMAGAAAVAMLLVVSVPSVRAQQIGNRATGLATARQLCAECHAVGNDDRRSPNPDAPTFPAIAAVPGMTALALRAALNTSHRSMPNILLTPAQQADLIAYILSLK